MGFTARESFQWRFDFALAHAPGYTKCGDKGQSEAFYDFNTGVIVYRRSQLNDIVLNDWSQIEREWQQTPPPFPQFASDQHSFRRALWQSTASLYVLGPEYNYRTIFPGRVVGKVKIIHGRVADYEGLAARLNAEDGPRLFPRFCNGAADCGEYRQAAGVIGPKISVAFKGPKIGVRHPVVAIVVTEARQRSLLHAELQRRTA